LFTGAFRRSCDTVGCCGQSFFWEGKEIDTVCCTVSLKKNSLRDAGEAECLPKCQLLVALLKIPAESLGFRPLSGFHSQ
jgi:hypothetical protein